MAAKQTDRGQVWACGSCGWSTRKWVGRCGECDSWGTLEEAAGKARPAHVTSAVPITEVDGNLGRARATGIAELDRVLGGGIVPGSVALLAGEPGVGKSTLLLELCAHISRSGGRVLYLTGEESTAQVRGRAERIAALNPKLYLAAETNLAAALSQITTVAPDLLVIDSVQTMADDGIDAGAGQVSQIRAVAAALIEIAKSRDLPTVLVGHLTKDGSIAGPRALEHLVDVVLQFEGDRHTALRLLRAVKNRYGSTEEVGCFSLSADGMSQVTDPSLLFISGTSRTQPLPGSCITVSSEGRRPLLTEIQALVAGGTPGALRRVTSGADAGRVALLHAVLERRVGVPLRGSDVYLSSVGGIHVREPAADLAIAIAVTSAARDQPCLSGTIAIGEVGLTGEVRPVPALSRRIMEAARLGFHTVLAPPGAGSAVDVPADIRLIEVPDVGAAVRAAMLRVAA
ncbi:MAG: DNA repair protein RadA [Actinomycetota bacterium]